MKEVRWRGEECTRYCFYRLFSPFFVFFFFLSSQVATLASLPFTVPPSFSFLHLSLSHSFCLRYLASSPSAAYKVDRHFIASVIFLLYYVPHAAERRNGNSTVFMDAITAHPDTVRAPEYNRQAGREMFLWIASCNSRATAVSLSADIVRKFRGRPRKGGGRERKFNFYTRKIWNLHRRYFVPRQFASFLSNVRMRCQYAFKRLIDHFEGSLVFWKTE